MLSREEVEKAVQDSIFSYGDRNQIRKTSSIKTHWPDAETTPFRCRCNFRVPGEVVLRDSPLESFKSAFGPDYDNQHREQIAKKSFAATIKLTIKEQSTIEEVRQEAKKQFEDWLQKAREDEITHWVTSENA